MYRPAMIVNNFFIVVFELVDFGTVAPATTSDADNDGYTVADGDCNDNDASVYPGATEIAGDGVDQDCVKTLFD